MIFVTLGTQDKSFERLLKEIDVCIEQKIIKEKVIVQSGYTKYESKNMEIVDFMDNDQFQKYIDTCSLLITHGGAGSILTGMKKNKKVIAIPRLAKYKEHTNDHQLQIVNNLSTDGYILKCTNLKKLGAIIKDSKNFTPKKYKANNKKMLDTIENYISTTNNKNKSILILLSIIIVLIILIVIIYKIHL